ncbi:MAG: tetratricopeptide repeat protein [Deltaproteobacteria bacterium]|nr:tetratricopeptide repeat protein [Deltaproteobacteria bacterium]
MPVWTPQMLLFSSLFSVVFAAGCGGAQGGETRGDTQPSSQELSTNEQAEFYMEQAGLALAEDDKQGALEFYLEAATVYDGAGEVTIERAEAHFLSADLAYQVGEKMQAAEEYDKAVQIYLRFSGNSKIKAAVALNNMGTIYKEMEQYDKARNCWENALQIYKAAPPELQSPRNMAKIQQNLSDLHEGF